MASQPPDRIAGRGRVKRSGPPGPRWLHNSPCSRHHIPALRPSAETLLWRDANAALLRYLRVIAPDAAEDIAAETWLQVVRGLPGFRGDQLDWRAWLFTTARRRAIDGTRRRARRPTSPLDDLEPGQMPSAPMPQISRCTT
jgi:DNA-directed RNA polymerase specialized sigma24 family protein